MDPYFKQTSYPILSVFTTNEDKYVHVTQSSYYDPNTLPSSPYNYSWYIPITWTFGDGSSYIDWVVDETSGQVPLSSAALINVGRETYARIKYDDKIWDQVLKNLKTSAYNYSEPVWAATLTDTYSLVNAGQLDYWSRLMDLLKGLKFNNGEVTWRYGAGIFDNLVEHLKMTETFPKFKVDPIKERIRRY